MGLKDEHDCAPGVRVHGSGEGASQKLSMGHAGSPRPRGLQPLGLCHCDLQRQKGGLRGWRAWELFFKKKKNNWKIIALQCCVSFRYTMMWICHMHTHIPSLPTPLPTTPSTCPSSTSASLLLPWRKVRLYHFSRFHIYVLLCNICFALTHLLLAPSLELPAPAFSNHVEGADAFPLWAATLATTQAPQTVPPEHLAAHRWSPRHSTPQPSSGLPT